MTLSKKQFCIITLLLSVVFLACLLLLCGCGDKSDPVEESNGVRTDAQGNWTTDGNIWFASSGDVWSTDGNAWYPRSIFYPETVDGVTNAVPFFTEPIVTDGDASTPTPAA